jgi:hypothetical protein
MYEHFAICIIPPGLSASIGNLRKRNLSRAKHQVIQTLTPHVEWAVGAFDFSYNDISGKGGGLSWQPHFHLIARAGGVEPLRSALAEQFPNSPGINAAIHVEEYDGSTLGASYIFKPTIMRRSSYIKSDHPTRNPFSTTRDFELRARPHIDISLLLDSMGIDRRLLFINLEPISLRFMKRHE